MLDQGDHPAGHEPRGPDRGPGPGHLADLYDTAPVGDIDAAPRPGRRYLVRLGPLTGINHDLDAITLHRAASRRLNLHSNIYLVRSQAKRPPREPAQTRTDRGGTRARSAQKLRRTAGSGQYDGSEGSTWLIQASTPPPTCTASVKPAFLTIASASAERAPLLQCSTIRLSCGSRSRAAPDTNSPLGMSVARGRETISYSFGARTSTRKMLSPASSMAARSLALIVEPMTASAASSDTAPQNSS